MIAPPVLHDEAFTRKVECARLEAQVQGVCVECGVRVDRSGLDASARCDECRP